MGSSQIIALALFIVVARGRRAVSTFGGADIPNCGRPGSSLDCGPLVTMEAVERVRNCVDIDIKEGATLTVDGRGLEGYENGFYMGGCLFDKVTKNMRI